jgi:Hemerythrin HHE cation binding domain
MTSEAPQAIDTRDMVAVHRALERGLGDAAGAVGRTSAGDTARAEEVSAFLAEVLWLLEVHHHGEDEILYPLLAERVPDEDELYTVMNEQHEEVLNGLGLASEAMGRYRERASDADASDLVARLGVLRTRVADHAEDEETSVLPIAAVTVTPPEWGALPAHALGSYRGDRLWLPLGLVMEAMPDDVEAAMFEHLPPPLVSMWRDGGAAAFEAEVASIREG